MPRQGCGLRVASWAWCFLILGGCTFKFDRELGPGELRAKVLLNTATGEAESWEPAVNARFRIVGSGLEQRVGANGTVVLRHLPPGNYEISITHARESGLLPDAILLLRGITIDRGGGRDLGTLKLGATGGVSGRALLDDAPVANAAIVATDSAGIALPGIPLARSGEDGRFSIPYVPAGPLRLHALFRWTVNGAEQTVTADSAELTVPPRSVLMSDVLFTAPAVAPPSVLKLQASAPDGTAPPSSITVRLTSEDGTFITRADLPAGSAEIGSLTPGIYTLTISADGFQDVVRVNVLVEGTLDLGSIVLLPVDPNANLCDVERGGCDSNADCSGTATSATCACRTGFTGNGYHCVAVVNGCTAAISPCDANATCTPDMNGEALCQCLDGFTGDGHTCTDDDECATNNGGCPANSTCANSPGGFACPCDTGYEWDGAACSDVDECAAGHGPCDPVASCTNTIGSFTCDCPPGFGGGIICLPCDNPEAHCCETPIQFCSRLGNNCDQFTDNDACGQLFTANCGTCSGGQVCGLATANICLSTGTITLGFAASVLNLGSSVPTGFKSTVHTAATAVVNDALIPLTDGGFAGGMRLAVGSPIASLVNDSMWAGRPDGGSPSIPTLSRSVSTRMAAVENVSAPNIAALHNKQAIGAPVTAVENIAPPIASYPPVAAAPPVAVSNP